MYPKKKLIMKKVQLIITIVLIFFISNYVNAQPTQEWFKNFNGQSNYGDQGKQIIQLSDGNIVVAGNMINFSTETAVYFDVQIFKMNSAGDTIWTKTINIGDFYRDEIVKMLTDDTGNIYLAINSGFQDVSTMEFFKFNLEGEQLWHSTFQKQDTTCIVADMVLDSENNPVIAGFCGIITNADIYLLKYDNTGNLIHTGIYTGTQNRFKTAVSLAIDAQNNTYIGGHETEYEESNSYTNMLLLKFNQSCDTVWTRKYQGPSQSYDFGVNVKVDNDENIYFGGFSESDWGFGPDGDMFLMKYNSVGDTLWTRRYDGGYGGDWLVDMVLDNENACYITGWSIYETDVKVTKVIKYAATGNIDWTYSFNGNGNYFNDPNDIELFPNGDILVAANFEHQPFNIDWNLICLNNSGQEKWQKTFAGNGTTNLLDAPLKILTTSNTEFYVTGHADMNSDDWDLIIAKYSINTSIAETKNNQISVFPNPANEIIYISDIKENSIIQIIGISGKLILELKNPKNQININTLSTGIYFLKIQNSNEIVTKKFIKQ